MSAKTVREVTYDLLRKLDMTVVFGNPGSTEQPFLKEFPSDFKYILGLQEASVVAMADGYAQATGKPVLVNLHTSAGIGNGMGTLMTAFLNKTPMVVTAGQQIREMLLMDPLLANRDATQMPRPWVKWTCQPDRAEDVPAAIMRAYITALQPPCGPVFVSIPLDDWERKALGPAIVRSAGGRIGPDLERLHTFADRITKSKNPVLVYGGEVDRSDAWAEAVQFAEQLGAPVYQPPVCERAVFPENHELFAGVLPPAIGPISKVLAGHDLIVVIGAPVFRYYPFVPGDYIPAGSELLQISCDPNDTAAAAVGDSLISDVKLALQQLISAVPKRNGAAKRSPAKAAAVSTKNGAKSDLMSAEELWTALCEVRPEDAVLVQESPSNFDVLLRHWKVKNPKSYFSYASGGLGWNAPAAVGIALGERESKKPRPIVACIGDGSFQYSVQNLYTAAQHKLKIIYVVPCNGEYAILKSFAELEKTPGVPGLDLPGLDIVSLAKGYGCKSLSVTTTDEFKAAFSEALKTDGPTVIAARIQPGFKPLVG